MVTFLPCPATNFSGPKYFLLRPVLGYLAANTATRQEWYINAHSGGGRGIASRRASDIAPHIMRHMPLQRICLQGDENKTEHNIHTVHM